MTKVIQFERAPASELPGRLLTPQEACEFLQVSKSWLDKSRMHGHGPRFCRIGRRVRYRPETLTAFAMARERERTLEAV